nr:reverse transcriptase domain-containing protein [Tanacetum cinerariifolium]
MKMNTASSLGSGTLSGNTITNPKEDLKGITTRSRTAYPGPTIPTTSSSLVVKHETGATKDTMHPSNNGSAEDVQPPIVLTESIILNSEPVVSPIIKPVASPVSASRPNQRPSIPYPSRLQDQKLRDKANDQRENFFQIFKDLNFNISFADALILMPKFDPSIKSLLTNKDKLALADLGASINLMPLSVWNKLSLPDLSPTCMTLELNDHSISRPVEVAKDVFVKVGTFHFLADNVVVDFDVDPRVPLILRRSFLKTGRALIDVFNEAFLNDDPSLPPLNQGNYLPGVYKELKIYEAKSENSSINEPPEVELKDLPPYLEYAFLEGDDKLPVIIAKDLSVEEETALITLNKATRKDHFPLPFMDQMLERLAGNQCYCFLDGFSGYFQILIDPKDQKKTTFTCPYGTFAYRRIPFGLCNAPCTFQRCMMAIFHDIIKKTMEVFMDDFSVFGNSFQSCLSYLEKMLKRSYFIMNKSIVYTDHSALKYLFPKKDSKARFLRWVLLLQEFIFKVIDTKGAENLAAYHLSRLENPHQNVLDPKEINESFPLETLNLVSTRVEMSRDVLTVGSTTRIALLYRGEYSQWVERFMNYLDEQTDVEAIINSIKNEIFLGLCLLCEIKELQRLPALNCLVCELGSKSPPLIFLKSCGILLFLGKGSSGDGGKALPAGF